MYKIAYIDEQSGQGDEFLLGMEKVEEIEAIHLLPKSNLDRMIAEIEDNKVDAVVIDYVLDEIKTDVKYKIPYDGIMLAQELDRRRINFPSLVFTYFASSEPNGAEAKYLTSFDLNRVYDKKIYYNDFNAFKRKIIGCIELSKSKIYKAEKRCVELIQKRKENGLTASEEDELVEMNVLVEKSLGKTELSFPKQVLTNQKRLNELIHMAEKIITKYQNE